MLYTAQESYAHIPSVLHPSIYMASLAFDLFCHLWKKNKKMINDMLLFKIISTDWWKNSPILFFTQICKMQSHAKNKLFSAHINALHCTLLKLTKTAFYVLSCVKFIPTRMQHSRSWKPKATFSYLWIETEIGVFCHDHDVHDCDYDYVTASVHDGSHADL